ncbi:extracellular solute-binding protein [Rhizobium miluonense]|uniref:Multiple sugar transport system substrate-binding protein n=1 Tax=Rhizobium miluonense TaxID=411945 RepID=A0A1C3X052_9HYPH|nr:extracellular solute-binding protein [Rhizobium miluonense]SCB45647.1 multiple sugar transport system substrate-binding protein [Rhizobium miluonense]
MLKGLKSIVAAVAIVAASSASYAEEGKILRVTAASSDLNAMWVELCKTFEKEHPGVTVELDNTSRNYDDLVQATLRASITHSLPDISFQGANSMRVFIDRKLAVPLNQFLNTDTSESRKALSPAVASIGSQSGETYALGFGVAEPVVYFNLDLMKKIGFTADNLPKKWDDIISAGDKITKLGDNNLGLFFQYDSAEFFWDALIFSQGARLMKADESDIAFDGPEGLKALEIIAEIGKVGQASSDMSRDQARSLFAAGKLAILFDSNSNLPRFETDSKDKFQVAVGVFPMLSEKGQLPAAGSIAMMFADTSARQLLAWEFLKFVTGPTGQGIVAHRSGWIPANDFAIQNSPELRSHFDKNPNYHASLEQLPKLTGWYAFPGPNSLKITKGIVDVMRDVMTLKKSPQDGLGVMATSTRKLLASK